MMNNHEEITIFSIIYYEEIIIFSVHEEKII